MSGFASTWPNASTEGGESNPPPEPGTYSVSLQDARAFESKAGNEVMVTEFRILDGPREGYVWSVVNGFKTPGAAGVAKSLAVSLGADVEVTSLEELDANLKLQIGLYYEVAVKQNGEWVNTYVNGSLTAGQVPESDVPNDNVPTHVTTATGDDVPF
jgi:hypothetical protein